MDEFDVITEGLKNNYKGKRVALILMFDELPGATMDDLMALVHETYEVNVKDTVFGNLTVTAVRADKADEIEEICRIHLEDSELDDEG